jgi:hypothetical protein
VPLVRGQFTGLGVMPRGSVTEITGDTLRLFLHWRQAEHRTDYDLSAAFLTEQWTLGAHCSYTDLRTNLRAGGGFAVHSGDLVEAPGPDGATEFIDINLTRCPFRYIVTQVNQFGGEPFGTTPEGFTGWMSFDRRQRGVPFEPRTVRTRSDLGKDLGHVALPALFYRGDDGRWRCKWMHLYLDGMPRYNQVETNSVSTSLLAAGILGRDYLRVSDLLRLMSSRAKRTTTVLDGTTPVFEVGKPVTYVGLDQPEGLPDGSTVITLANLEQLVPE